MVDQAAGTRSACGDPHPACADQRDDLGDGEEVAGEPQVRDGRQFILKSLERQPAIIGPRIPLRHRRLAALPQQGICLRDRLTRRHRSPQQHVELRHEHLAEAEVGCRVEGAVLGQPLGVGEQPPTIALTGRGGDLVGDLRHLLRILDEGLAVVRGDMPGGQRHQPPRRVEHIGHPCPGWLQITHGIGEDDGQLLLPRPAEHGCRGGRGMAMPASRAMRGDGDAEPGTEDRPPRTGRRRGPVRALCRDQSTDLGVGGQQCDDPLVMLAQHGPGQPGQTALGVVPHMRGGHQPAQGGPTGRIRCQQQHPRLLLVDPPTTVCRSASDRRRTGRSSHRGGLRHHQVHAEDRADPGRPTGQCPPDRAVQAVAIGQAHDRLTELGGPVGESLRGGGAVLQGVPGCHVQMAEGHGGPGGWAQREWGVQRKRTWDRDARTGARRVTGMPSPRPAIDWPAGGTADRD